MDKPMGSSPSGRPWWSFRPHGAVPKVAYLPGQCYTQEAVTPDGEAFAIPINCGVWVGPPGTVLDGGVNWQEWFH